MSRVINTSSPSKMRNQARRTIAEILRHLLLKKRLDEETKDMAAAVVFALRQIDGSIDITTEAWEKRNYFLKADRFRLEWEWVKPAADQLEDLIVAGKWEGLAQAMSALVPRFSDIRIVKMTRDMAEWKSSYALLLQQRANS